MIRLILLTDFTEGFSHRLLQGILRYAKKLSHDAWVVCRMPPSYKEKNGIQGVVDWALNWKADAIVGQFNQDEDVELFAKNGILAVAQDYKRRFTQIPNITSNYIETGRMVARYFLSKGFRHFAFCGYEDTVWSDERCEGYFRCIEEAGFADNFYTYKKQILETLWYYDSSSLAEWLKSLPPRTALFCCDDNQGNKIEEACKSIGISIPGDIAVMGVDNDEVICELSDPTLSSINLDIAGGGYETARLIAEHLKNPETPLHDVMIQPQTIVSRNSTNLFATDDPYVFKALELIHRNICKQLMVSDLLKELPLSRRLLEIKFKQVTGQSIYNYIMVKRIDFFARMLEESDTPIKELASTMDVGSYGSLMSLFKKMKGCTPSEYRNRHR
uniref:Substrate-binding domain-containing protein n=1 Tax=Prevotella sp. GTC17259 TaxID=3236795 RepID=A0AB33J488_9BACT